MNNLQKALTLNCSYNEENKANFKKHAMSFLRKVAKIVGNGATVRFNAGGVAGSGDAQLHSENVYVNMSTFCMGDRNAWFSNAGYYRTCKGTKDYTGGTNNSIKIEYLDTPEIFAEKLLSLHKVHSLQS